MKERDIDKKIVEGIEHGGGQLAEAMRLLSTDTELKMQIDMFVRKQGGTTTDAEDVFQEGIRYVIMNIRTGKYQGTGTVKAYLATICKNIWRTQFSRHVHLNKIKNDLASIPEQYNPSPEQMFMWNEKIEQLNNVLKALTDSCRQVLGLWSLGFSFKEIASQTNQSEGGARKRKHDCFKKMMRYLKNNPAVMRELKQLYQ